MNSLNGNKFVDSILFIARKCYVSYSAEKHEDTLVIDLNIEDTVNEIMKNAEALQDFDKDMTIVLKVGEHSIRFSREVEVVKKVKTKGWNIASN